MAPWQTIFQAQLDFVGPAADVEDMLSQVPAKWVVYLFADGDDQPVQLLCVKNLRASLKRRLGGDEFARAEQARQLPPDRPARVLAARGQQL
jgi:hypothetical protein